MTLLSSETEDRGVHGVYVQIQTMHSSGMVCGTTQRSRDSTHESFQTTYLLYLDIPSDKVPGFRDFRELLSRWDFRGLSEIRRS